MILRLPKKLRHFTVQRGARVTSRFEIGWTVFTNQAWLDQLAAPTES